MSSHSFGSDTDEADTTVDMNTDRDKPFQTNHDKNSNSGSLNPAVFFMVVVMVVVVVDVFSLIT